jgi:putative spermidine/putrescine transport system substrate-binding protein
MRRRDFLLGSTGLLMSAAGVHAEGAAEKPSSIAVMTWGGQFGDVMAKGADHAFEQSTGVRVLQDRGSTPVERITKVKINEQKQIYDVMQLHDGLVPLAMQQGAYEKLDLSSPRLSNVKKLLPGFAGDYWIPFCFSELGLCYNTKEVKNPPTKFADLWRPEFKGRIVLPAMSHSIGPYIIPIGAIATGHDPNDEAAGFEQLQRMSDLNPIWARDTDGIMSSMRNGEAVITLLYRAQTYTLSVGGAPVAWVAPEEGAIEVSWGAGIAKGCRNRDLAEEYINILMSPACQVPYAEAFNYPGSNPETMDMLSPDLKKRVQTDPAVMAHLRKLDHAFISAHRAAWTEKWNRIVSG